MPDVLVVTIVNLCGRYPIVKDALIAIVVDILLPAPAFATPHSLTITSVTVVRGGQWISKPYSGTNTRTMRYILP